MRTNYGLDNAYGHYFLGPTLKDILQDISTWYEARKITFITSIVFGMPDNTSYCATVFFEE